MRGAEATFSRRPSARALIAGAAMLASAVSAGAVLTKAAAEEMAFVNPRIAPGVAHGLGGADLPQPLAPSDAARLRQIFALQAAGHLAEATAELAGVADPLLNGHVLAQRYLGPHTRSSAAELATWLARYPDHPDAAAIHALLRKRVTAGTALPPTPDVARLEPDPPEAAAPEEDEPAGAKLSRNALLDRTVHERARAGNAESALSLLRRTKGLGALYGDQLRAEVGQTLFTQGRDAAALRTAQDALAGSGGAVGLAGYVAGLAAWRLGDRDQAQSAFEAATSATLAPAALRSGAAFWAARAHARNGDSAGATTWLKQAAQSKHTFYGLLARRTLRLNADPQGGRDTLGAADVDALMANPHGHRAFALLQVGQSRRAEAELRCLWPQVADDPGLSGAVLRVAEAAGLMDFAAQIAGLIEAAEGRPHDEARFPIPALRPAGGFRLDPPLVYALARLESNFDPGALSGAGARGLMQVMPITASYVTGHGSAASYAQLLYDPATNLDVGQSYVLYLAGLSGVRGNLIRLLGSYNAGPSSFARMADSIRSSDDPLLFIESIPNDETRGFIPRALTYSWIYAARLHLPSPSLDQLAAGAWPSFSLPPIEREAAVRLN